MYLYIQSMFIYKYGRSYACITFFIVLIYKRNSNKQKIGLIICSNMFLAHINLESNMPDLHITEICIHKILKVYEMTVLFIYVCLCFSTGIIEQFFYPRISQDFTLPCNIKGITANTPIVWYKGDQRFIPDSRRVRIVNNAIVFRPAIAEDSGSYSCMRPDTLESIRAQLYVNGDGKLQ